MIIRRLAFLLALISPAIGFAAELKVSVPLQHGRLDVVELRRVLESELYLPPAIVDRIPELKVAVDLRGLNGWVLTQAINGALGDGFHLDVRDDALIVNVDTTRLPRDWQQSCDSLNRFTRIAAPEATARQARRFGLHLPQIVDSTRPMVVLIHGLDGNGVSCEDLAGLARSDGFQTSTFVYPAERPLGENADLLCRHLSAFHERFPRVQIDLVTESMGGLIAREYVEGPAYTGGVDRLIMIAPPNEGSNWVGFGWMLKLVVNAAAWKNDSQWSPAWMITEGICQESRDLRPQSTFLDNLNSWPRRSGVRYTIIAGNRPAAYRYESKALAVSEMLLAGETSRWWGFRDAELAIDLERQRLLERTGDNDGPVRLGSACLAGVEDFVVLPVDHIALFESVDGQPPAAWPIIHDRLTH